MGKAGYEIAHEQEWDKQGQDQSVHCGARRGKHKSIIYKKCTK